VANLANKSFSAGELAPALYSRTDLAKYEVGLRQCRNFIVARQGGVNKRPGTLYVTEVKDSTKRTRLIPFVFNISDTLVLEFGEHYIRFIQNAAVVEDPASPPDPYEIATPYLETDLPDLQYVQSADVVTIVHPTYPPKELKRFGDTNWTLTDIVFNPSIAAPGMPTVTGGTGFPAVLLGSLSDYVVTSVTAQGEESLQSLESGIITQATDVAPIKVEWTAVTDAATYKVYKRVPFKVLASGGSYTGGVFAYLGETIATAFADDGSTLPDITLQPPVASTLFQSISNYPAVVTYYQQRLVFAASNNNPDTIWASRTGFYHNFTTSVFVQDDDAITFRLVSEEIDRVRGVLNVGRMVVLSDGAEWIVEGDGNGTITPSAVNARIGASDGVAGLRPIKAGNQLIFLQALGAQVRELQANVQFGYYALQSSDLTIYSSHLVDGYTIVDWCWQQVYPHVLWAVRSDGVLLALTYIPEQEVFAWSRHDTQGFVEAVACVPEGREHRVYWIARRLIAGSDPPTTTTYHRYIEWQTSTIQFPQVAIQPATSVGGVVTPPPPPPPPPPNPQTISPPTNPSTTDITTTTATANWTAGNLSAASTAQIQAFGSQTWVSFSVPAGQQSFTFTGLNTHSSYQWRVQHVIGTDTSDWLGPTPDTQFATAIATTPTLIDPASAPTITDTGESSGVTATTIQWPESPQGGNSNVQIAGPTSIAPTDGEFSQVGFFAFGQTGALWNITATGDYWLRVRYELSGFVNSQFVTSNSSTTITVLP
jgi:hypothetical protein